MKNCPLVTGILKLVHWYIKIDGLSSLCVIPMMDYNSNKRVYVLCVLSYVKVRTKNKFIMPKEHMSK